MAQAPTLPCVSCALAARLPHLPAARHAPPWLQGRIFAEWFKGGRTNIAYNCLDRHVKEGHGAQPCFLFEGNDPGRDGVMTYEEVLKVGGCCGCGLCVEMSRWVGVVCVEIRRWVAAECREVGGWGLCV